MERPEALTSPIVFASPHSGQAFTADFSDACIADIMDIRRIEDAYVDQLVGNATKLGAPLIAANVSRACLDLNRAANEIDQVMLSKPIEYPRPHRTPRVIAGLGCIPRVAFAGSPIYGRKLAPEDVFERLESVYHPYHNTLETLIDKTRKTFGMSILVDCHSMPSQTETGAPVADIVLGDRYGAACSEQIIKQLETSFRTRGYQVARNAPYAGGHVTVMHGRPDRQRHAVQIEINRRLYLDEHRVMLTNGFKALQQDLDKIFNELHVFAGELAQGRKLKSLVSRAPGKRKAAP